jgi:hypothetical protein
MTLWSVILLPLVFLGVFLIGAFILVSFCFIIFEIFFGILWIVIFDGISNKNVVAKMTFLKVGKYRWANILTYISTSIVLCGFAALSIIVFDKWLEPRPTPSWQLEARGIDTAVILGFGYERDSKGRMAPGETNSFLLTWAIENTSAKTLFVQEGVWAAACGTSAKACNVSGRELRRIHLDTETTDVNTREACFCAIQKMTEHGQRKAIVVAHPMQLQRAFWDLEKVKGAKKEWASYQFIVPEISDAPFPSHSVQWRTRNRFFYTASEVFARTRDYLGKVPSGCKAPL